jgi:FkbM family methyltransferase
MTLIEVSKKLVKKILPFALSKNEEYDMQTIKILKKVLNRKSNTIDIGAHKGTVLKYLIQISPEGKHYAFEPIPECAEYLREKYSKNTSIFELALSNEVGEFTFNYVVSKPQFSGLKKRPHDTKEIEKNITVNVSTLDTLV